MSRRSLRLCVSAILLWCGLAADAQAPHINTLFPIGGKAGTTVEVEIRGSGLAGADSVVVSGQGVSGKVESGGAKADDKYKPIWQSKCGSCHELRSPSNRSMTPAQWAATVDRMIKAHGAPISADEASHITDFLQSGARAGRLTATLTIAQGDPPGLYEVRVGTPHGVSTAGLFEVGNLPEVVGVNGTLETAQVVKLPCVANGTLAGNAERHYYKFNAARGQRLVFNLKGFRYNESTQMYFNPNLRLYDAKGIEIAESHGYHELDPLIDWTCPADGDYTIETQDLLGRGNPGSVYRLTMGSQPYDTVLYPPAGQPGARVSAAVEGKNLGGAANCTWQAPQACGIATVGTPVGPEAVYISPYPVARDDTIGSSVVKLPALLAGRVAEAGKPSMFHVQGDGAFEFEIIGARLGSPLIPSARLQDSNGRAVARVNEEGVMAATLDARQTYTLNVEDREGKGGAEYVYCVEARPAKPEVGLVSRPDSIGLRPGAAVPVQVRLMRRDRVEGDVTVTAEGLPAGVTATPAVIQPDRQDGWLILSAPQGTANAVQPIRIVATAHGHAGEVTALATPQETYYINNGPYYIDRTECVLAVRGEPDFAAKLANPGPIVVQPGSRRYRGTEVRIHVDRKPGFKGQIIFRVEGLPNGWVASPEYVGGDRSDVILLVRPDGNNTAPFLNRDPKLTPIEAFVTAEVDDQVFLVGTAAVIRPDKIIEDKEGQ